jgi:hypothetical protein
VELIDIVNELSNTIDLPSTLMRAESLFRRFQRTVEAIDKKSNFPAPKLRQRPASGIINASIGATTPLRSESQSPEAADGSSTGADIGAGAGRVASPKGKGPITEEQELVFKKGKVISPELRDLLSRKVFVLPRKEVRKKGEGVGTLKK